MVFIEPTAFEVFKQGERRRWIGKRIRVSGTLVGKQLPCSLPKFTQKTRQCKGNLCHKTVNKLIKKTGDSPHRQECEIMHYQLSAFPKIENDQTMEVPRPSRPCGDKPSEIRNE